MSSGPELRGENTSTGPTRRSLTSERKIDQQGMRERERERERTSQSNFSWSLTITSLAFPLPSLFCFLRFVFSCELQQWISTQHPSVLMSFNIFFTNFYWRRTNQSSRSKWTLPLEVLQPVRVELTSSGISRVLECVSSKNESFLRPSRDWRHCRGNRKEAQSEFRQREIALPKSTREVWLLYFDKLAKVLPSNYIKTEELKEL